jgi:lysophospholipase L1-like esterase
VLGKLRSGQDIKVTFIGDSGLEGLTVTTPGTDDAASLVCGDLGTRFGVTVTKSNRAVSGQSAFWQMLPSIASPTRLTSAIADAADLYVISAGHNDIRSDLVSPGTGYPLSASLAAVEHMVRRIRYEAPGADILISNEWPYTGTSFGSNTFLVPHSKGLARVAAFYGCGFVDFTAALAAKGVTGQNQPVDDVYIHPTGDTWAQHPNSAGHRVWADAILAFLPDAATGTAPIAAAPTPPVGGLYAAARYGRWASYSNLTNGVRTYGTDGYRLIGTWAGSSALPVTGAAGDQIDCQFIGSECALRLDTGTGQGTVKISVDAVDVYASIDLATHGTGQTYIPLTGLPVGYHRVVVTVLSGSVTFRGLEVLTAPVEKIPYSSSRITYTGAWAVVGANAAAYYGNTTQTTTQNDSFTVTFVGTQLALAKYRYTTLLTLGVTVDGVPQPDVDGAGATANDYGGVVLVAGLPYGRHTAVVTLKSPSRALEVSALTVYDETRLERPTRVRGVAKVGETVALHQPLPTVPSVRLSAADSTSTAPPYPSATTASGFTANGTAAALVEWEAEAARSAW